MRPVGGEQELEAYVSVCNAVDPRGSDLRRAAARAPRTRSAAPLSACRAVRTRSSAASYAGPSQTEGRGAIGRASCPMPAGKASGARFCARPSTTCESLGLRVRLCIGRRPRRGLARLRRHARLRGGRPAGRAGEARRRRGAAGRYPTASSFVTIAERPELLRASVRPGARGLRGLRDRVPRDDHARRVAGRGGDAPRRLIRRARRRRDRRLLGSLPAARRRRRGRAHGRAAGVAPPRPGGGAQAGRARVGGRQRHCARSSRGRRRATTRCAPSTSGSATRTAA